MGRLLVRRRLVAQPEGIGRLLTLQVGLSQDGTEGCAGILESVPLVPPAQADPSPSLVFQLYCGVRLAPRLRLFEGKPLSVDSRPAYAAVGTRLPVQHPITAKADQHATGFILQRPQEVVVTVLPIADDEIQPVFHLLPPQTAQSLDLRHSHLCWRLLAGDPPH